MGWRAWESWGAPAASVRFGVSATALGPDGLAAFMSGGDGSVWTKVLHGERGEGAWESLGGQVREVPAAVSRDGRSAECFVWTASGLIGHWARDAGWLSFGAPEPGVDGAPAAVALGEGRVEVFVRGGDGHLWSRTSGGAGSAPWIDRGVSLEWTPRARRARWLRRLRRRRS
jgi:hypothetical protein